MLNSIEQLTLKTGQEVIIMSHRDIIDTIRDTLGDPLADLVATELTHATKSYEDELKGYEADIQEKEGIADSYAAALRDISDELEVLEGLLEAPRLNRDKIIMVLVLASLVIDWDTTLRNFGL